MCLPGSQAVMVPEALAYYDEAKPGFALEAGTVDIQVGASSADIRATGSLTTSP